MTLLSSKLFSPGWFFATLSIRAGASEKAAFQAGFSRILKERDKLYRRKSMSHRILARFTSVCVVLFGLSACGTINIVGDETVEGLSRAQQQMRVSARNLSSTVWEGVKETNFMGSLASLLLSGKDEAEGPGLVPDTDGPEYLSNVYLAQTERDHSGADAQLAAMVKDIQKKTVEARALVQATKSVVNGYKNNTIVFESKSQGVAGSDEIVRGIALARADVDLLDDTIENALTQVATFETAREAYEQKNPSANTDVLDEKIDSLNDQITQMVALSSELKSVTTAG